MKCLKIVSTIFKGPSVNQIKIQRALFSVSDKTNLIPLAKFLTNNKVEIISTGGTGKLLSDNGISYTPIEEVTGNPEVFDGRVKTLSFNISSALLFRRENSSDVEQAKSLNIKPIDLVVCNLYPFEENFKKFNQENKDLNSDNIADLIEYIDIGGPTMVRSAAKNFSSICCLTDPNDYSDFIQNLEKNDLTTDRNVRLNLAFKAFNLTCQYENQINQAFTQATKIKRNDLSSISTIFEQCDFTQANALRYGENPQQAAWVIPNNNTAVNLTNTIPIQGKELSYNNLLDAQAAYTSNGDLNKFFNNEKNVVTIIKHGNPCGACVHNDPLTTLEQAWSGDPISSFGSIIALNHEITEAQANWLVERFVELIIAPKFNSQVRNIFKQKKNLRLLELPNFVPNENSFQIRSIDGGFLVQESDTLVDREFNQVTNRKFDPSLLQEVLPFGTLVTKHLKSNAISLVGKIDGGYKLIGAGMGNPNRLVSLKQAVEKAQDNGVNNLSELVLISDAFFPFADNIELANEYGINYIVQPGGSIKDNEVIEACNKFNMAMVFTGNRHFNH